MSMSGVKRIDVKKPAFAGFVLVIVEVFKGHINDRAIRHINFNHDINLLSWDIDICLCPWGYAFGVIAWIAITNAAIFA
jgi:predicted metalloenzyme YecM